MSLSDPPDCSKKTFLFPINSNISRFDNIQVLIIVNNIKFIFYDHRILIGPCLRKVGKMRRKDFPVYQMKTVEK